MKFAPITQEQFQAFWDKHPELIRGVRQPSSSITNYYVNHSEDPAAIENENQEVFLRHDLLADIR